MQDIVKIKNIKLYLNYLHKLIKEKKNNKPYILLILLPRSSS